MKLPEEVVWAEIEEIAARRDVVEPEASDNLVRFAADAVARVKAARAAVAAAHDRLGWRAQSALRVGSIAARGSGVTASLSGYLRERLDSETDREVIEALARTENELRSAEIAARRIATSSAGLGLTGLCLSGGGIRSATFNLGVIQAFAKAGMLGRFDYLSSVSGGGYIGGTVSAMLSDPKCDPARDDFPLRHERGKEESAAMRHLRRGASYLAPDGFVDKIRIPALVLRGLVVNLLLLLPYVLVAVFATAVIYGEALRSASRTGRVPFADFYWPSLVLAGCLMLWALLFPSVRRVLPFDWTERNVAERAYAVVFTLTLAVTFINTLPPAILYFDNTKLKSLISGGGFGTLVTIFAPLIPLLLTSGTQNALGTWRERVLVYAVGLLGPVLLLLIYLDLAALWILSPQVELTDMHCWYLDTFSDDCPTWRRTVFRIVIGVLSVSNIAHVSVNDWAVFVLGMVVFTWGWYAVDVNLTALHGFYRDRLSQAYLFRNGAYQDTVQHVDNLRLSRLSPTGTRAPYHLINATLNLQASREAGGRRADFFLFSKRFTGSRLTGYCETSALEALDPRVDLGTAIAVSGAALAPNTGTITNRALVFVMTLLNVRTGYWLPNPLKVRHGIGPFRGVGPAFLILELFGLLQERRRYINVSDGGHVENLGLYELIRRRCRFIVVSDAEQDERLTFAGLAKVIQYARIDGGVDIDINLSRLRPNADGASGGHWVLGRIRYGDGPDGALLYIKASLTGDEPEDVKAYRMQNDETRKFPHEPTAQQFFKEGQFEAYRVLGYHIGEDVATHWTRGRGADFGKWFDNLRDLMK